MFPRVWGHGRGSEVEEAGGERSRFSERFIAFSAGGLSISGQAIRG